MSGRAQIFKKEIVGYYFAILVFIFSNAFFIPPSSAQQVGDNCQTLQDCPVGTLCELNLYPRYDKDAIDLNPDSTSYSCQTCVATLATGFRESSKHRVCALNKNDEKVVYVDEKSANCDRARILNPGDCE